MRTRLVLSDLSKGLSSSYLCDNYLIPFDNTRGLILNLYAAELREVNLLYGSGYYAILDQRLEPLPLLNRGIADASFSDLIKSASERSLILPSNFLAIPLVGSHHPSKYAHFMRDTLAREFYGWQLLGEPTPNIIIIDESTPETYIAFAKQLFRTDNILKLPRGLPILLKVPHISCVEPSNGVSVLPRLRAYLYNNSVLNRMPSKSSEILPNRIYLKRSPSDRRALTNESELTRLLKYHGFASIIPSELSISDQLKICMSSKIIITQHGAHALNAFTAEPSTKMIEIAPYPYILTEWAKTIVEMSIIMGHEYYLLLSRTPLMEKKLADINTNFKMHPEYIGYWQNQSSTLDIKRLDDLLQSII